MTFKRKILIFWALLAMTYLAYSDEDIPKGLSADQLAEEVISSVNDPNYFNYRRLSFIADLGYISVDEQNNFDSHGYHLGLTFPNLDGFSYGIQMRRILVESTTASDLVGRTPFTQDALYTRYEFGAKIGYSIIEGRSFTRFGSFFPDFGHAFFLELGLNYHLPCAGQIPRRGNKPNLLPGQRPNYPLWVLEPGLRFDIYIPEIIGFFFGIKRQTPLVGRQSIGHWWEYTTGVSFLSGYK